MLRGLRQPEPPLNLASAAFIRDLERTIYLAEPQSFQTQVVSGG
jgi:hypothetical protein